MNERTLTYAQAITEATDQAMQIDPSVFLIGQGTRDPGQIFGTVNGLFQKYGPDRVMEMPLAENAVMGLCLGAALGGMRPLYVLQRADFLLLTLDLLLNHAARWHFMFGGRCRVPLVVRCIIGKGWGQGPQHSQALHATLAHFPGLRVVLPSTPRDAKGLLLNALFGSDPTVILEARPLHGKSGPVPEALFTLPFGSCRVSRLGADVTLAATSYLVPEAEAAAESLAAEGIAAEVVDLVSASPVDIDGLEASVRKTGRLVVADVSWSPCGLASEISAEVSERLHGRLKAPVRRITPPFCPTPTAAALEALYYPNAESIRQAARSLVR
jgi:pyruvate dehydrogenase E1 component beta subunit